MSESGDTDTAGPSPSLATAAHLLSRNRKSPGRARDMLRSQLAVWRIDDETTETAVLLLSELVTNAVCHGKVPPDRWISVRFLLHEGSLRLEVADANNDVPQPRSAGEDDESGRGLSLVAALTDEWGMYRRSNGIGKCVWVELKLSANDVICSLRDRG